MKDFMQNENKVTGMRYQNKSLYKQRGQIIPSPLFISALAFTPLFSLRASPHTLVFPLFLKASLLY
ncbi:hypothetical protein A3860_39265 [Niastella vici]|uniref:Uncharacterized protein n=1 Tax=Niastella vici TaxID=1703345 RepID=A0A1V9FKP4_9BACT|nr:hypothetical protein A3860_39265 [Niastella vici]